LHQLIGLDDPEELNEGVTMADRFPGDATFTMHPDFPYNLILTDSLRNTDFLIVASSRLRDFLEKRAILKVEYLPVTIINHKRRAVKDTYYIIHPVDHVDCLDLEKCGVAWSPIDSSVIDSMEQLVLDPDRIDQSRGIFRPKFFPDVTLIKRELALAMDMEGFTGNVWIEPEDYPY
jgi:hypothetical protein